MIQFGIGFWFPTETPEPGNELLMNYGFTEWRWRGARYHIEHCDESELEGEPQKRRIPRIPQDTPEK